VPMPYGFESLTAVALMFPPAITNSRPFDKSINLTPVPWLGRFRDVWLVFLCEWLRVAN
jgi:hypothetical protein